MGIFNPYGSVVTAVLLLLAAQGVSAQVILGKVVDFEDYRPIAAAEVALHQEGQAEEPVRVAVTDTLGLFSIADVPTGDYQIRVSAIGYEEVLTPPFQFVKGNLLELEITASPDAVPVAPLRVVASRVSPVNAIRLVSNGYYERKEAWGADGMGLARFLDPEDLKALPPSSRVSDYLQGIPGVYVGGIGGNSQGITMRTTTKITRNRCDPAIFLDGTLLRITHGEPIDKLISASSISAIEVYPAINKPAQFGAMLEAACGAIVIWTGPR